MKRRHVLLLAVVLLAAGFDGLPVAPRAAARRSQLPARLTDQEFWRLVSEFSEPGGTFRSDNLLSNERGFQMVIPALVGTVRPDQVYLGVGPEQNFTYMAAVRPAMAFIVDVRRGNLVLHLIYKALFELSADRAEFLSRLFSRPRPAGVPPDALVSVLFAAFMEARPSAQLFEQNLDAVTRQLVTVHRFPLTADDLVWIEHVTRAFFTYGPEIQYSSTGSFGGFGSTFRGGFGGSFQPVYAELMTATNGRGEAHSFLASEDRYQRIKDLQQRNLVVPLVGDFAGTRALRAVGRYLRDRTAIVSAFYLSNVEQYLRRSGSWDAFCANAATLPIDRTSTFIRAVRRGRVGSGPGLSTELSLMGAEVRACAMKQ